MTTEEYFIGLRKDTKSGEWRWISDGSKVNDTKGEFPWATNEPSGRGNCAVMYKNYRKNFGKYSDLGCTRRYENRGYICERPDVSSGQEDNCQGVCLIHDPVPTNSTLPGTTKPTTQWRPDTSAVYDRTTTPDPIRGTAGEKQTFNKDNCSSVVIVLASLVAVLSASLLILGLCFLSWRKKQRKDVRSATDARDQLDNQDESSLTPENAARELGHPEEAAPCDMKRENERKKTNQSSNQECGYAMLTPRTMMMPGDTSYASLVECKDQEGDFINESSVAASPLLQHGDERRDPLPTYVNLRSVDYANV